MLASGLSQHQLARLLEAWLALFRVAFLEGEPVDMDSLADITGNALPSDLAILLTGSRGARGTSPGSASCILPFVPLLRGILDKVEEEEGSRDEMAPPSPPATCAQTSADISLPLADTADLARDVARHRDLVRADMAEMAFRWIWNGDEGKFERSNPMDPRLLSFAQATGSDVGYILDIVRACVVKSAPPPSFSRSRLA